MPKLLKKGLNGKLVKDLQTLLNQQGYPVDVDGGFGQATHDAVVKFQTDRGLEPDGIVGNLTWDELNKPAPAQTETPLWKTIPMPGSNKSKAAAVPTLSKCSELVQVNLKHLQTFVSLESNYDYLVKASTSSATGWFQFLDGTWDDMLRLHGEAYGLPSKDDAKRSLRLDPRANALMGACFLRGNDRYLRRVLNRQPTDVDLYLAHFMGAGGARQFLLSDQQSIASSVFPKQAKANVSIFYTPDKRPRTLAEIYKLFDQKIEKHR